MPRLYKLLTPAAGALLALVALGLMFSAVSCSGSDDEDTEPEDDKAVSVVQAAMPGFIGAEACAKCHEQEHGSWVGSHHDAAMKIASDDTVLGDFNNATFEHFGTTSRFFKKDGKFFVHTDGPDGAMADFEIAYTFGVEPLQQYLVKFDGGKVQSLTIAWDTRPKAQGGQRWYHLYPDAAVPHTDPVHWAGPNFTWNHMCAECHSTDLKKNFDAETNTYDTTWAEINVSCEACHGPGENHAEWAKAYDKDKSTVKGDMGLAVRLKDKSRVWVMDGETGIAKRQTPLQHDTLVNACARCHSRRGQISDNPDAGTPFLDNYHPALLTEGLYHADGQIQDEVYVWGSYVQSKMHMAGVTCVDCHDPHTARVPTTSNNLCARCHQPAKFDTIEHHHHTPDSPGASCIDCHMPHQRYMGVDDRRDHSIRIPRPDLSLKLGTPNACNQCHTEQSTQWAADAATHWWGVDIDRPIHYGEVFADARKGELNTDKALLEMMRDPKRPGIVRATAVIYLARYPTQLAAQSILEALTHEEPLVRAAAADMLRNMPPQQRIQPAIDRLDDPLRLVRMQAANALVDIRTSEISKEDRAKVRAGIDAYRKAQRVSEDTAAATMNLGSLAYRLGDVEEAKKQYQRANSIDPSFMPVYSAMAELNSLRGEHKEAMAWIERGHKRAPDQPDLLYTEALVRIRMKDLPGAVKTFGKAYAAGPDRADLAYAYAAALFDTGERTKAVGVLEAALKTNPNDMGLLNQIVQFSMALRQPKTAIKYAKQLHKIAPDAGWDRFIKQVEAQQP